MCDHDKPTRNDDEKGYFDVAGVPWRAPPVLVGEELVFDECGRCSPTVNGVLHKIDYHPYHFRVVREGKRYQIAIRHGGADNLRIQLGYSPAIVNVLAMLDSDARYMTLFAIFEAHKDAAKAAKKAEGFRWKSAAAEDRIKTRKKRGQNTVDVWIEDALPKKAVAPCVQTPDLSPRNTVDRAILEGRADYAAGRGTAYGSAEEMIAALHEPTDSEKKEAGQ